MPYVSDTELQRLTEQFRQQRDGCKLIADDYAAKVAGPAVWDQPANERRAEFHREQYEVYRDVVEELEAVFPWLKPEDTEEVA